MANKATATKEQPTAMSAPDKNTAIVMHDYGEDAGAGFENVTGKDQALPFLNLLQPLSKVVKAKRGDPGDLYNTVTEEVTPGATGILVVPATTGHEFVQWHPLKAGGGFVAAHRPDSDVVKKALAESKAFGEYFVGDDELIETFNIFAALVGPVKDEVYGPIVIPFTSTKIKAYKGWIGRVNSFQIPQPGNRKCTPPMFSHLTKVAVEARSDGGNDWHVYRLEPGNGLKEGLLGSLLDPTDARFSAAKAFREMINAGQFRLNYDAQERGGGKKADEGPAPF